MRQDFNKKPERGFRGEASVRRKLAEDGSDGDVAVCGGCRDVHVRWGNLMVSLSPEQFEAFSRMIGRARADLARGREAAPARPVLPEAWVQ